MNDPFLSLVHEAREKKREWKPPAKGHHERAHSKFAASAAERWLNCPGSVQASEGMPDKDSVWSIEGTRAHEVLETLLYHGNLGVDAKHIEFADGSRPTEEMWRHGRHARDFILLKVYKPIGAYCEVMVETRIYLDFIHPEMFGTFDAAILDHFGTLHVFDYKYGAGHAVSAKFNLQMVFYAVGLAYKYQWNFKRVRMWIIQPRIKGYDGPTFWEITIPELRSYVPVFHAGVQLAIKRPDIFKEGSWCHWCKAKSVCPLKQDKKFAKASDVFLANPVGGR